MQSFKANALAGELCEDRLPQRGLVSNIFSRNYGIRVRPAREPGLGGQETRMTLFPETRGTLLAALKSPEDRAAWDDFVVVYRPVFYRMARRRGLQDADAQDLSQQVLMRVSAAIERYEQQPGTKFRHWLRRVANNAIATALSMSSRDAAEGRAVAIDLLPDQAAATIELTQELDNEYERELYLRAAAEVRAEVASETWQAFELTMIDGMPCEAAAETLGKSIGSVYAARSRIVKRLRSQIERMQAEENEK
jgi:RNA polymerase sigma-70 factor (ECF subfamily)